MSTPPRQRTDEWDNIDERVLNYHTEQWECPKRSTIAFERFCARNIAGSKHIVDMGGGAGAATAFIAERHPSVSFTCFDYSAELVAVGRRISEHKDHRNIRFLQGDWFGDLDIPPS